MADFTKEVLDRVMLSTYAAGDHPAYMLVAPIQVKMIRMMMLSTDERWDHRREKREIRRIGRKSTRREYHKALS